MFALDKTKKQTGDSSGPVQKKPTPQMSPGLLRPHRFLQRAVGNSAFQAHSGLSPIIQRKCACGGSCARCAAKEETGIQAKLTVGAANDVYEQEADQVADQIMRMPDISAQTEEEKEVLQPKIQRLSESGGGGFDPGPDFQLSRSGGQGLSISTRQFMEPRFGSDFGHVRIHNDQQARQSAAQIKAKAFTSGNHIWLGKGASERDNGLIAHELTHVIQQTGRLGNSRFQRQAAPAPVAAPAAPAPARPRPRYTNCSANQSARMEVSRRRAKDYVDVAIARLRGAPRARTTYATASARHFISPTAAQRTTIQATYRRIRTELGRRNNYICDPTHASCAGGTTQAFWRPADDLVHICNRFWAFGATCRAIILIHEVAHDNGIDAAPGPHTPNRGSAQYPVGNTAPPAGQTTAGRMNVPDAYAFFAAHLWRSTDTGSTCF